ncbi:hypothetical protein VTN00DRAFT_6677 [Thermoascus crustaceus]|uniref:uncharacterized protein n=1 Tax=Thermoascus crustaceus TaxID=5088 RepID=UPI0037432BE6
MPPKINWKNNGESEICIGPDEQKNEKEKQINKEKERRLKPNAGVEPATLRFQLTTVFSDRARPRKRISRPATPPSLRRALSNEPNVGQSRSSSKDSYSRKGPSPVNRVEDVKRALIACAVQMNAVSNM